MNNKNYTIAFSVDQSPEEVFAAINNVRGWWSEEIDGDTDKPGAEFKYHYKDVHRAIFRITEFIPGKKVVWHVVNNYFNFVKNKSEWKGTDIVFEITQEENKTKIQFTHVGLLPEHECYTVCSDAWRSYITGSLHKLITTGKGHPNPQEEIVNKAHQMSHENYTTSFLVDQSPEEVFAAINNVRGWWSGKIEGETTKLGDEFTYRYEDVHYSKQKITELIPDKKIVWHVLDANLNFVENKSEWKGTDIVFEITKKEGNTEVHFTHIGLMPASECYEACSDGWGMLINGNLRKLITTREIPSDPFA